MKDVADTVGMPTEWDKENLQRIIKRFEKKNPGMISYTIREAKAQHRAEGIHNRKVEFGEVNTAAHGRIVTELPTDLQLQLEKCLPSLFRSKKHLRWFIRNFPGLRVPEKL